MSGTNRPDGPGHPAEPPADPSMDDILASIRRILNEDDAPKPATSDAPPPDDVLILDSSMMIPSEPAPPPASPSPTSPSPVSPSATSSSSQKAGPSEDATPDTGLIAPATAAATTLSMGALMRTLATERSTAVHRGGPTLEDLVRDEMRPLLKTWLDVHLPPLVERLVRAEIERVVGRMAG